ncbi:MAG: alpha/beta fold hydrolase [Dehalococcoidia bacterium]|nr:alpha/beta fold hydrolase [Dehalococcoidia bacterium]
MPEVTADDGVSIHYEAAGSGQPVLLITGAFSSLEDWYESGVFDELVRDQRVIALDLRGHGKSGKPHAAASYGWPRNATDALAVLEAEGARGADVYGFSMGGQVVVAMLHADTSRLRSLCAMGVYVPGDDFEPPAQQLLDRAASLRRRGLSEEAMQTGELQIQDVPPGAWLARAVAGDAEAYIAEAEGQAPMDDQRLPAAGPPMLLVAAEGDPFAVALCRDLPSRYPYVRYRQLDGVGHYAGMGRPMVDVLREFWAALPS